MDLFSIYLKYVEPFKGSKRLHSWAILGCMSALLERRCWFPRGGLGKLYPNQYIVLCGRPGSGKTVSGNIAVGFIKGYNRTAGKENKVYLGPDKATPAALLKRLKKCHKTVRSATGTFAQSAIFLWSTEFSTLITDIGGGSMTHDLLKLYDCDDMFEKELVGEGLLEIPAPCFNLLAATTPSFLSGFLPGDASGVGLTSRFIFATELGDIDMDEETPEGDEGLRKLIILHMARMHVMEGPFQVNLEAKAFWKNWYAANRIAARKLPEASYMCNFYARKPDHVRKVAMVLSAGRDSSRIITKPDFELALALIEEAEPMMDKSFGVRDFTRVGDLPKQIVDLVPWSPGEISKWALVQALYRGGSAGTSADLEGRIKGLVEGRLLLRRLEGTEEYFTRVA